MSTPRYYRVFIKNVEGDIHQTSYYKANGMNRSTIAVKEDAVSDYIAHHDNVSVNEIIPVHEPISAEIYFAAVTDSGARFEHVKNLGDRYVMKGVADSEAAGAQIVIPDQDEPDEPAEWDNEDDAPRKSYDEEVVGEASPFSPNVADAAESIQLQDSMTGGNIMAPSPTEQMTDPVTTYLDKVGGRPQESEKGRSGALFGSF